MKKFLSILIATLLISLYPLSASAANFTVNPFYAIKSFDEYQKVKDTLGSQPAIYYGWSRIAKNTNGEMVFTTDRNTISTFDLYTEYSVPETVDGKLTQEMRKEQYPDGKNLLMVFLSKTQYEDGSIDTVDFLNMNKNSWEEKIISPMAAAIEKYGFDGVVLDIEGIMDNYESAHYNASEVSNLRQKYNSFLNEVRNRLSGKTLAVCANMAGFSGYDYPYIYNTADQVILLDYPYSHYTTYQESDGVPELLGKIKDIDIPEAQPYGMVKSDIDKIMGILKQSVSGFNPKKILLGVTLEVNGWMEKELIYQSKTYKYYEKTRSLSSTNSLNISSLDDVESINAPGEYINESPVYKYSSKTYKKVLKSNLEDGIKTVEYYYDTPGTIFEKYYSLVYDYDLSGISVWRLGIGGFKTWSNIYNIFNSGNEVFEELPYKLNVPKDKTWAVKFNNPLDESTLISSKDNISVIDTEGTLLPASLSIDSASNTVKVSLPPTCQRGHVYYLIIGKSVKSKTGSSLSKPVILKFKIVE